MDRRSTPRVESHQVEVDGCGQLGPVKVAVRDRDTLVELMMVGDREGWTVERVVAGANALLDVRGDTESVLAAASSVTGHAVTPVDALQQVNSGTAPIVPTDPSDDGFADRVPLQAAG